MREKQLLVAEVGHQSSDFGVYSMLLCNGFLRRCDRMDPLPARLPDNRLGPGRIHRLFLKNQEISILPIAIAVLASILNLFLLGFLIAWAAPIADDYCRGVVGWQNALSFANQQYMVWTGRWTSVAIESFLFSAFNLYRSVPIILASLIALQFLSVSYLLRRTLGFSSARSVFWSVLLMGTWLSLSPGIGEVALWATGAIEYQLSLTLALFALALVSQSRWIPSIPFMIVAATMHELIALILTGICVSMLWMRRRDSKSVRPLILLTLLAASLTAFVVLAPGNFRRAIYEHDALNRSAVLSNLFYLVSGVARWTTARTTLGILLFLAGIPAKTYRAKPLLLDLIGWPCVLTALIIVAALIPYGGIPGRVWNLLCFVYLLFLFYAVVWLTPHLEIGRSARVIGLLLFSMGALVSRNFQEMAVSAIHAPAWNQALATRTKTHHFDRILWPRSYFKEDVTSDPDYWINSCVAQYLQISSVSCPTCDPPGNH